MTKEAGQEEKKELSFSIQPSLTARNGKRRLIDNPMSWTNTV
jgi:hypothetical protein